MRIDYDHEQLAHLLANDRHVRSVDTELRGLDLTDPDATRDIGLDLTYELITWTNWEALTWRIDELPGQRVDVGAGFEGSADGHVYLELYAFLALGAGIVSPGADSIIDLVGGHSEATAEGVLDGIVRTLTTSANTLTALCVSADTAVAASSVHNTAEATR